METTNEFAPCDRYAYDFNLCSTKKGFAQVDTGQDAPYFGTWASPDKLIIVCYCEGNITIKTAATEQEFVDELNNIKSWNDENGHNFYGIDPGFNEQLKNSFVAMGLSHMLH